MVSASAVKFWTGYDLSEEDAATYTEAVTPEFLAAGGASLPAATQTQALCYLIASKVDNANGTSGKKSESLGGYSYTRMSSGSYSSRWLDFYHELLRPVASAAECAKGGIVPRSDLNVVQLNRRYSNGKIF